MTKSDIAIDSFLLCIAISINYITSLMLNLPEAKGFLHFMLFFTNLFSLFSIFTVINQIYYHVYDQSIFKLRKHVPQLLPNQIPPVNVINVNDMNGPPGDE